MKRKACVHEQAKNKPQSAGGRNTAPENKTDGMPGIKA